MEAQNKKKGICCVCKETKQQRDLCILMKDEDSCQQEIGLHNLCLRNEGFNPDGSDYKAGN
jgi:cytochrome c oxidase assembly protein subunit 17